MVSEVNGHEREPWLFRMVHERTGSTGIREQ